MHIRLMKGLQGTQVLDLAGNALGYLFFGYYSGESLLFGVEEQQGIVWMDTSSKLALDMQLLQTAIGTFREVNSLKPLHLF